MQRRLIHGWRYHHVVADPGRRLLEVWTQASDQSSVYGTEDTIGWRPRDRKRQGSRQPLTSVDTDLEPSTESTNRVFEGDGRWRESGDRANVENGGNQWHGGVEAMTGAVVARKKPVGRGGKTG
jgi:hypothetical protein